MSNVQLNLWEFFLFIIIINVIIIIIVDNHNFKINMIFIKSRMIDSSKEKIKRKRIVW